MIDQLLRYFIPDHTEHLSDDRLASLFCGELPLVERLIARRHLERCWRCRLRKEDLEGRRADHVLNLYREIFDSRNLKLPQEPREEFARRLELHLQHLPARRRWAVRLPKIAFAGLSPLKLTLAASGVLGLVVAVSLGLWWRQSAPEITSNALLVRSEIWDSSHLSSASAVAYQSVRIASPHLVMDRAIYRDLQGKRLPKALKLAEKQENLKVQLAQAGVDWDEPMSASDYQLWHDHQHERTDKISRAGAHLLTLTTVATNSLVPVQSLTVRDTDFHPVRRTVDLPDIGTVEITELDYRVLPWSAVDANAFEPLAGPLSAAVANPARVLPLLHLPTLLTDGQLDEAELGARLLLNQLHADTGEPIEVHRSAQGVTVDGLVETEKRRRELQAGLQAVPHVVVAIQSDESLKAHPSPTDTVQSVAVASMPDQPSPLEIYFEGRGKSVGDINDLAQRLFNDALAISQESKEIVDLETRFGSDGQKTILASATLTELVYSHRERLEAALKRERELLADAQNASPASEGSTGLRASSLLDLASKNLALSKELTQTNAPATRSAEKILAEMSVTMDDLAATAHEAYRKSQGDSALSGKK